MQFLLTAFDGEDAGALERRMSVREEHLQKIENLKRSGGFLLGGAILDDNGKMIGSMILYEFPDRKSLDEKLQDEPYITKNVWKKVEIRPFRLATIPHK
ncbi:MAG: YciI family protein [Chloroflexota bacterium]